MNKKNKKLKQIHELKKVHAVSFSLFSFSFRLKNVVPDFTCKSTRSQGGFSKGQDSGICLRQKSLGLCSFVSCDGRFCLSEHDVILHLLKIS